MQLATISFKARLALLLLVAIITLGGLLLLEAYTNAQRAANRAFDNQLRDAALTIAESIQWQNGQPLVRIPASALQILATQHEERVFYSILGTQGQVITGNMPALINTAWQQAAALHVVLRDAQIRDTPIRLYGYQYNTAGWQAREPVQIWVGHTLGGRRDLANALFHKAVLRLTLMVFMAGLLMALAMHTLLKPLHKLRHELRQRDRDDTRPLHLHVPAELVEFTATLNALFARQRQSQENLLRFTADASHQIKTPLTGLRSACELALQSSQPAQWRAALQTVNASAIRTSRLAEQLLSLARVRHTSTEEPRVAIDMAALLRECAMEWAEREISRQHDLGLAELPDTPQIITGKPLALHELVGNLIDNALHYTPPGSHITLGLEHSAVSVTLVIEDDGPGVPAALLGRLHQPFERGGRNDPNGSGLGIAIVDSIARQHGARLFIRNRQPHGLRISIRFPSRVRP